VSDTGVIGLVAEHLQQQFCGLRPFGAALVAGRRYQV
jgi:hypothetical protein